MLGISIQSSKFGVLIPYLDRMLIHFSRVCKVQQAALLPQNPHECAFFARRSIEIIF